MPVYIRKNVSYTPPSLDKLPVEQEDDYINDPDLLRDDLPQPYRMIDKTLQNLIDDTWEVIATREEERITEANKVRPPQYEFSVQLEGSVEGTRHPEKQKLSHATCMCNSPDGQYVFIGLPCGLVAVEALNQHTVGIWEEDGAEMVFLKCYMMSPQAYLITSIDDMGTGRLFAFTNNKLFLVKALNSQSHESDNKVLVGKMEASVDGDYLGMVMEHGGSHELWLEVHKLPKDTWVSDLDTIVAAMKKKEEKEKREEMMSEDTESVAPSEVAPSKADTEDGVTSLTNSAAPLDTTDQSQRKKPPPERKVSFMLNPGRRSLLKMTSIGSNSARSVRFNLFVRQSVGSRSISGKKLSRPNSVVSKHGSEGVDGLEPSVLNVETPRDPLSGEYKFGAPQLIMKVKPPHPATGVSVANLLASCQKVDSGDVVGTGHNLLFTQNNLDLRKSVFDHLHDNLLKYQSDEDDFSNIQQFPQFHFLTAGRMLPQGLEQASLEGRPTVIAVWWPGSTNLMQYSLIKSAKDVEFKPDLVWPFTCKITCTEVSPDTNIIAVGLENGNVVIWDRYMGSQRGVVNIRQDSPVVQIKFLDTALFPQDSSEYPPYPTGTGTYILAMCANSALYTVSTGARVPLQVNTISLPVESDSETITVLEPLRYHPDMTLTVTRHGDIQIRDTLQGKIICQVKMPDDFEMSSPWEPVLAVGGQGQNMYVKGNKKKAEDSSEIDGNSTLQDGLVFVYQLRSFPSLDEYWKMQRSSQPLTVHVTVEQRAEALLADRLSQQPYRKNRMQERWAMMREEINNIHQLKDVARLNAEKRIVVTPGSIGLPVKPLAS